MPIEWFDNRKRVGNAFVSIDRLGRMSLSRDVRTMLDVKDGEGVSLYIGFDKETKTLALIKTSSIELADVRPFKFDGVRYYSNAKHFIEANQLPANQPIRFYHVGEDSETGALLFRLQDR
ncbi:hypothetical protein [Paenibacillus apiarius]|uniref:hypothetical protein n=1 Tax=Paenibacillus apiarius TaxID=46240 RepID=UPI003B3AA841